MAHIPGDGKTRVVIVDTIADITAPTEAELNGGLDITCITTRDGVIGFELTTAEIDASTLCSTFEPKSIGIDEVSGTMLRLYKQTAPDAAYNKLIREYAGFVVIRRDIGFDVAWTAGQEVEVWPIICGSAKRLQPEKNTLSRYEVPAIVSSQPEPRAQVAA